MTTTASFFETFVPETRQPRNLSLLEAGQHLVTIERREFENDHIESDEPNLDRDWDDKNEVLYLYLTSPAGVFHLRYYVWGHWKYQDIVKDSAHRNEIQFYRRSANKAREYAIDTRTNKRIINSNASKFAQNLIHELCTAAGNGVACSLDDIRDKQIWIELVPEYVNGKKKMKVLQVAAVKDGFKTKARAIPNNTGIGNGTLVMAESLNGETVVPMF